MHKIKLIKRQTRIQYRLIRFVNKLRFNYRHVWRFHFSKQYISRRSLDIRLTKMFLFSLYKFNFRLISFNRIKFKNNSEKLVKEKENIGHPFPAPRFSQCVLVSKLGEDTRNIYIRIYSIIQGFFFYIPLFSNSLAFVAALSALCHVSSYLVLLFLTDLLKFPFSIFAPSVALGYWRDVASTNSSFLLYAQCLVTELFLFTFQSDSIQIMWPVFSIYNVCMCVYI